MVSRKISQVAKTLGATVEDHGDNVDFVFKEGKKTHRIVLFPHALTAYSAPDLTKLIAEELDFTRLSS